MSPFTRRFGQSPARIMLVAAGVLLAAGLRLGAIFMRRDFENVPIERVTQNLERQVAQEQDSGNVRARLNLARVHAMAWASKTQTTTVVKAVGPVGSPLEPYFGEGADQSGFQTVRVVPTTDQAVLAEARRHLDLAIRGYEEVLKRAPGHVVAALDLVVAKLGRAWCLDQAGDKARAIEGYREVLADLSPDEPTRGFANFKPTAVEVAGYLIPLLDPVKDSDEIAALRERVARIRQGPGRPITPVVVPLRDGLHASDLVDPSARVLFDADGSGIPKRWSWITPDAGWLVYDRLGRRQTTSALQFFGSVTFWLFWQNGYDAMRALDDDGDGELRGPELAGFAIWRDANRNGLSEPGEVRPLDEWGVTRLSCAYEPADDGTTAAFSPAGVTFANGVTRPTYDLLLYPR